MKKGQKDIVGHQDTCPVCGKARSTGLFFIDHGACVEKTAAKASARHPERDGFDRMSDESRRIARRNVAKKKYLSGKLPGFMFD
jgi:hypothetical protein